MKEVIDSSEGMMRHKHPEFHFLMTSFAEWHTGKDLVQMTKRMNKAGYSYNIWYVPVNENESYSIRFYQPQVAGSVLLQCVAIKQKRRATKKETASV